MRDSLPRILFVHNGRARFVQLDFQHIQERYLVTEYYLRSGRINPATVAQYVATHDLVFGWFASWHTFLPLLFARVLSKPSLLVIGGYDLANIPEIGYGHQRGGLRKWISRWTMRLATCLVTNSCYSQQEATRNAGIPKDRVHVVYHGVPDPLGTLLEGPRSRIALTVGNVDRANLWRKGLEPFVRAGAFLPDVEFVVAGGWKDDAIEHLRAIASPNITFTGWLDDDTLLGYYRRASVYVQASWHEGFGLSVAEAMLAGCIPLVTHAGALPEVVGDCGVYVSSREPASIAQAVKAAMGLPEKERARARERILKRFPLEKRRRSLDLLINHLLRTEHQ